MNNVLLRAICIVAILSFLNGCTSNEPSKEPLVNSGSVDEKYVGDADPILKEKYKQTDKEAQIQADTLKKIQEKETAETESDGAGGHF